jgi:hypothetical protein
LWWCRPRVVLAHPPLFIRRTFPAATANTAAARFRPTPPPTLLVWRLLLPPWLLCAAVDSYAGDSTKEGDDRIESKHGDVPYSPKRVDLDRVDLDRTMSGRDLARCPISEADVVAEPAESEEKDQGNACARCFDSIWANEFARADCAIRWTSNYIITIFLDVVVIIILIIVLTYLSQTGLNLVRYSLRLPARSLSGWSVGGASVGLLACCLPAYGLAFTSCLRLGASTFLAAV